MIAISSSAQSISFSPNDTLTRELEPNKLVILNCYISNLTPDSLDIEWNLISNTLQIGWDYSLCDFGTCYPGIPTKGTMKKMGLTDTAFLKITINPLEISGAGIVSFVVVPKPGEYDTVTFIFNPSLLSIVENNLTRNLHISPNPASDYIAIDFSQYPIPNTQIYIYNTLGEIVKQENFSNEERNILSTSDLQEGIYFLSLQTEGQISETKKIVISR